MSDQIVAREPEWRRRRFWFGLIVVFLMLVTMLTLHKSVSDAKAAVVLPMTIGGIVSMAGLYIFGAAWENRAMIAKGLFGGKTS